MLSVGATFYHQMDCVLVESGSWGFDNNSWTVGEVYDVTPSRHRVVLSSSLAAPGMLCRDALIVSRRLLRGLHWTPVGSQQARGACPPTLHRRGA